VEFDIDVNTDQVSVKGDHPDADRIEEAVNGNEELKEKMKTLQAIASHVHGMEDSLAFQREYRASSNPASVVAKYAYLFSGNRRSAVVSIVFDGGNAGLKTDGKDWAV
jgi:hypothetical protein